MSFLSSDDGLSLSWQQMGMGAPTVIALAQVCAQAMANGVSETSGLSGESHAILFLARDRGIIEIKGTNTAFESANRFLTVYVELEEGRRKRFRKTGDPQFTIRFLEGFRELCANGLVMHHLYHEFSLTRAGFQLAAQIDEADVQEMVDEADECGWE